MLLALAQITFLFVKVLISMWGPSFAHVLNFWSALSTKNCLIDDLSLINFCNPPNHPCSKSLFVCLCVDSFVILFCMYEMIVVMCERNGGYLLHSSSFIF